MPFRYYGEVLDPELSNLSIFTFGIGFRPSARSSVDLVLHRYKQKVAASKLRGSKLDADPSGLDSRIGDEVDLVIGYREQKNMRMELVLGYFFPGKAFDDDMDGAAFGGVEMRYSF